MNDKMGQISISETSDFFDDFKYLKLDMYDCKIEHFIGFSMQHYMG